MPTATMESLSEAHRPILKVRRLVSDGRHNAFTDLLRWRGEYLLTYRRSSGHGVTDGDIVLLASPDGQEWTEGSTGLRDSENFMEGHLAVLGNRLFMFGGGFRRGGPLDKSTMRQWVSVSDDAVHWSEPQPVYQPLWRFWRPRVIDGALYCAAYTFDRKGIQPDGRVPKTGWTVNLVRSTDGLDWRDVSTISKDEAGNETELLLDDDGTLHAFCRCEAQPGHLIEHVSKPPYATWGPAVDRGEIVQGQVIERVNGRTFMVGRRRPGSDRFGTIYDRRDTIRTQVWVLESGFWVDYATLPSAFDCSYAGIAKLDEQHMLVSYYSQHEHGADKNFKDMTSASDIYLATVRTDAPAEWGRTSAPIPGVNV